MLAYMYVSMCVCTCVRMYVLYVCMCYVCTVCLLHGLSYSKGKRTLISYVLSSIEQRVRTYVLDNLLVCAITAILPEWHGSLIMDQPVNFTVHLFLTDVGLL